MAATPETSWTHVTNFEIRVNPSGLPRAHSPHDNKPINWPFEASGPPESPLHVPCGSYANAQSVPLFTNR